MKEQAPQIDVQQAFDPVLRAAQQDMDTYADNRPGQDELGAVHDPATGRFIDPAEYFDRQRAIHEESSQTPYEEMTMPDLARKLAEAEYYGDKTTSINVSDVLLDKLSEYEAKQATTRPKSGEDDNNNASDNIWNRIMSVKDKELARLKEEHEPSRKAPDRVQNSKDRDLRPDRDDRGVFVTGPADGIEYDLPASYADARPEEDTEIEIPDTPEANPALAEAVLRLDAARNKFAEVAAARGRKTFTSASGKYGKQALENARYEYEKQRAALAGMELASARRAGVDPENMELAEAQIGKSDAKRLAERVRDERLWLSETKPSKHREEADEKADIHLEKLLDLIDSIFERGDGARILNSPRLARHIENGTNHEIRQRRTRLARKTGSVAIASAVRVAQATRNRFKKDSSSTLTE